MGDMRVIETRDYKWDRGRSSRCAPCSAGRHVSCAAPASGGRASQTIFHARNREKRIDDLPIHLQGI
ncbi:hypothetical protein A8E36_00135 [Burkholderia cenocepacia]|uniref:Uncharacterized protein n=1 Tax=Burkholderia cenocepacia TaxID=95486 RepID=A0A1V2XA51_9BURK|nr:hypothetical protein A8D61_12950 [Burkholderia cenocepacia]EPZ85685.1 hypothetical protein BURCENK562V_C5761 [Burkholderia cenocepacia K56-2Valvano]ERI27993.1 hypothetical protein BURCENBC7_AP5568 [Burkholderia cenocepacia BC7]CDN59282.1 hypothetical protein I35_0759 [Burkholderia cenocepacia H111]AQQ41716.1 hypothetical protein A8E75_22075 [Burkholderia cenocepacia]